MAETRSQNVCGKPERNPHLSQQQRCGKPTEVFSRIVGYFRPVQNWNDGKREEFKDRLEYAEQKALAEKAVRTQQQVC